MFSVFGFCQSVGIGTSTPDTSAILDLTSSNKGLLMPRVADTSLINTPKEGMVIFNQNMKAINYHDGINWRSVNNANSTNADSITVSVNGSPEVKIISFTQEATQTLDAQGRPSSSIIAGQYSFSKKFDPVLSNQLKNKCYDPFSTSTITIKLYSNGASFCSMVSTTSYVFGCKDSFDTVNGYVEVYSVTAKKLDFSPSGASHDNGWPL